MTNIFFRTDLSDDCPPGVCSKCAQQGMEHRPTGCVFAYCRYLETGMPSPPNSSPWPIWATVEALSSAKI
jgi:hypothetical protein